MLLTCEKAGGHEWFAQSADDTCVYLHEKQNRPWAVHMQPLRLMNEEEQGSLHAGVSCVCVCMQAAHFAGLVDGALLPLLAAALVASGIALDAGLDVGTLAGALDGEDDTVLAGDAFAALMLAANLDDGAFGELTAAAFFFSSGCGAMRQRWLLTDTARHGFIEGPPLLRHTFPCCMQYPVNLAMTSLAELLHGLISAFMQ